MTENYSRLTGKVFAGNAPQSAVGQFGSALNGTKVNTTDVSIIQDLPAYTEGWSAAIVTNRNYPTLEEMNGAMKVMSYQTAYTLQKGIPEWDEGTTYFSGDMCKAIGSGILYTSRSDNNIGHPVTDTTYWIEYTGSASQIPATNYVADINGVASFSNNTVTLPDMTLYIPNGLSGNGTGNNKVQNVSSATYTLSGSGDYHLFYNNNTGSLHLAPDYKTRLSALPNTGNYDDVAYLLDNKMYTVESTNPNYVESSGVSVSDSGIVSSLGSLSATFNTSIPARPVLNLNFTTGSDITATQDLFALPYAEGVISDGKLNIAVYSLAYAVRYYTEVYSGAYSLTNQAITYSYDLGGTVYYTASPIQLGITLYSDPARETVYGTVTSINDTGIIVSDSEGTELYSGSYSDTSTRVYTYTIGNTTIYTPAVFVPGLTVYSDSSLSIAYGIIESITTSNVVIHTTDSALGYVAIQGTGAVHANNSIYSDINLQTLVGTSTGANSTYTGDSGKSAVGSLTYELSAFVSYSGTLIYNGISYTLILNDVSTSLLSSRNPYSEAQPIFLLGGSNGFGGSIDLNETSLDGVWSWNGHNTTAPEWQEEPLCKLGTITLANNEITALNLDKPIELVKFSDLSDLDIKGSGGVSGSGFNLFDLVQKDHVLTYEESAGFAQLGTYVYKEAIAGSRYGYPDFYAKCLEEYQDSSNTTETVSGVTITVNPNGHKFYNISDKSVIDGIYTSDGAAWYYGIDTENERVFLPRNNWFFQNGDSSNVGEFNEAGLPNIEGDTGWLGGSLSTGCFVAGTTNRTVWNNNGTTSTKPNHLNASLSSSVYGNSDTVQPPSVNTIVYMVVGNTTSESAVTDVVDVTTTENDTLPLFAGMYFEFSPNSVSWLKAGTQANSGDVYSTAYNELVNELTNPKYGLKVINTSDMISGVDYSEYWKVNQDEEYFICPSKISYSPINGNTVPVVGNEDAKSDTAQLYFKVANAVQNLELLDAGEVLEALSDKIGFSNKSIIMGWYSPDWSKRTTKTKGTNYTAESAGWVSWDAYSAGGNLTNQLYINNVLVSDNFHHGGGGSSYRIAHIYPVSKGDTWRVVGSSNVYFTPVKGAN